LGNILSQTINAKTTEHNYQGNLNNIGSNYANPDAVTQTAGDIATSYKYDRNGNLISDGLKTYSYDYNNRLTGVQWSFYDKRITYAYDAQGQRVKSAVYEKGNTKKTYYPTQFYNIAGDKNTKHVFANNLDIATIEGSGADAVIYFNFADQLQSSSVTTDASGAIVETTDYYAFGKIRTDNKTTDFTEQRKYIGQEFDEDTGLNYLNARYYNSAIARFVSQDPVFWNFDSSWLSDPQNQNAYAYARNNPITFSDPSGKTMWIESKSVFDVKGNYIGIHTYFKAVPDHPNEINIEGLPQGTEGFTMGGYNSDNKYLGLTNKLIKNMGTTETSWDKDTAFGDGVKINSMEINPPEGQNDTQFINNFGKNYNEMDISGTNYSWWGKTQLPFGLEVKEGNCNVFTYTLGTKSGVKDQLDAFNPDPNKTVAGGAPGYGYQLPSQTLRQQIQGRVDAIRERINNYVSSLIKK